MAPQLEHSALTPPGAVWGAGWLAVRLALGTLDDRVFCVLTLREGLLFVFVFTVGRGGSSSMAGVRGVRGAMLERGEGVVGVSACSDW